MSAFTTRRPPFNIQVARIAQFESGQQTPLLRRGKGNKAERPNVTARQLSFGRSNGASCTPESLMGIDCYSPSMSVATASSMASTPAGDRSSLPWQNFIDPAGQNRGHDCRDDDGSGDLRIRGGRKLGIARSDLGEGDRRGHGRAGNGGTCHSRLTIAATQALEGKGNGTDDKERDEAQQDARKCHRR